MCLLYSFYILNDNFVYFIQLTNEEGNMLLGATLIGNMYNDLFIIIFI